MNETDLSIQSQVAAKCATEIIAAGIQADYARDNEQWTLWFKHIGGEIITAVRSGFVTAGPPPVVSAGRNHEVPAGAPHCPTHGAMVPGPGQSGKPGPLWKCSQSKWDRQMKVEVGCPNVVWDADA